MLILVDHEIYGRVSSDGKHNEDKGSSERITDTKTTPSNTTTTLAPKTSSMAITTQATTVATTQFITPSTSATTVTESTISSQGTISIAKATSQTPENPSSETAAIPVTTSRSGGTKYNDIGDLPPIDTSPDIVFYLYNPYNLQTAVEYSTGNFLRLLTQSPVLTIITHDWKESYQSEWIQEAKNNLSPTYISMVLMVDWSKLAQGSYLEAATSAETVGTTISSILSQIDMHVDTTSLEIEIYALGMGIGAHIVEIANFNYNSNGRSGFTAVFNLSPAGPYFDEQEAITASKGDTWIYYINTNVGRIATTKYRNDGIILTFNGGVEQPGCASEGPTNPAWNLTDPIISARNITEEDVCSHRRSFTYFLQIYENIPEESETIII